MIDIHTHILPHLDDGAKDTATSLALLQEQMAQGVTTVVFTPHYYGRKHSPTRFLEKRSEAYERLKGNIPSELNVRLGAEVHFSGINVPEYDEFCKLAIEGTTYLLLELPFTTKWTRELTEKIADFVYETGYTPIIAHVERYKEVLKKPTLVNELVEMGCLIQVNAQSFLDKKQKGFVFALVKHGLVHCIGSDTHDMDTRKPCLAEAKIAFEKEGCAEAWEYIQSNMQKVLSNEEVEVCQTLPIKKKLFGGYR